MKNKLVAALLLLFATAFFCVEEPKNELFNEISLESSTEVAEAPCSLPGRLCDSNEDCRGCDSNK